MKTLLLCAACAVFTSMAGAVEVDGIAATVGTETILKSAVLDELRRAGLGEDRFNEVRNSLIERRLIVKAAADAKMTMQEWVVDNRIREIVDSAFEGDRNKLIAALAQQKLPYPEWRTRIKDDLIVNAMRWNTIEKNVSASPAEMRAEFKANPARYNKEARVWVLVQSVKPGEKKPTAFDEKTAKKYDGVDPKEAFHPTVLAALAKLKKGETSDWIEMDGWNFRLRKTDETAAGVRTFAEAYDDIEQNVRKANAEKLYRAWMDRLKAETYIKIH